MIRGLNQFLFRIPVQAGEIVEVMDRGQRLKVKTDPDLDVPATVEVALSRGMAVMKRPQKGHYLIEYPGGHIDILSPESFAAKALAGVSEHGG